MQTDWPPSIDAELDRLRDCLGSIRAHLVGQESALAVAIRATCNSGLREYDCPQCGCQTFALYEGYCHQCRDDNQRALDQHNAEHDRWQAMTDSQRDEAIRRASRA